MGNATRPGCSEMGGGGTGACVDSTETINDNRLRKAEGEIDIIARKKQTDAKSEIYYAMHLSKNRISITPDKTNKSLILISF